MEYRELKHFDSIKKASVIGIGAGNLQDTSDEEIEHIFRRAVVNGINVFDLCAGGMNVFAPVGRAIKNVREKLILQLHFGAGFDELGQYEWIRNEEAIRQNFEWQLEQLNTDYADVGILHCVDDEWDIANLSGVIDMMLRYKAEGKLRRLGFSADTPEMAVKLIDMGIFDVAMMEVNPFIGMRSIAERGGLYERLACADVVAMRVFDGGSLLDESRTPFEKPLTAAQCLQYALNEKGIVTALAGVRSLAELDEVLLYDQAKADWYMPTLKRVNNEAADNVVDMIKYKGRMAK